METTKTATPGVASPSAQPVPIVETGAHVIRSAFLVRVASSVDKDIDHPQFFDPSYPLKYLEAGLQRMGGVRVDSLDCWIHPMPLDELVGRTEKLAPDLVVVSASSFEVDVSHRYVAELKRRWPGTLVVGIGQGHYFTAASADASGGTVAGGYDAILLGEPEEVFFELLEGMQHDRSSSADWRTRFRESFAEGHRFAVQDSDVLSFPRYSAEELEAYRSIFPMRISERVKWGYMIAMRGCPHLCTFCSEVMRVSVGRKARYRSPENVVDEMEYIKEQGANVLSFQDDSFSTSKKYVKEICEEILRRKLDLPWMARVRADEVDRDHLTLMRDAGCRMLGMGVEAGSQRIVDRVVKNHRPKPWADICRETFKWTRELGIGTNAYYVIGNPGETRAEIEQTIDLAVELNSDTIQVHFFTPYPGSSSWDEFKHMFGDIHDPTQMFHYGRPLFSLAEVSVDELIELRSKFYRKYIFRPSFILPHMWNYKSFYWHNRDIFWTMVGIRKVF